MQDIENNLARIHAQIDSATSDAGRVPGSVLLLAVSKKKPVEDIRAAYAAGQRDFGENYLQEALQKMDALADLDIRWHFIGAIQSNKTRDIAARFDWAHCIDRAKVARRLGSQRPAGMAPLNVCIQVNLDDEASKAGVTLAAVPGLAAEIVGLEGIRLRGLMTIPAPRSDIGEQRASFARLAQALAALRQQGIDCDTLSMGMTGDMSAAIAEGSTLVRIGTAIFGERL